METLEQMLEGMLAKSREPLSLLREVVAALDLEVANRDGQDPLGIQSCDRCDGGLGVCSLGCRIKAALKQIDAKKEA